MHTLLQIAAVLLVAIAMGLALAHALELPGKLKLSRDVYAAVQPIYYPGFPIGGALGEGGGLLALVLLLLLTEPATTAFWWTTSSFLALAAMHAVYWLLTHPVNNFWLEETSLSPRAARFFKTASARRAEDVSGWTSMRDQWEYSHVIRAALGLVSLASLTAAVAT